MSKEQAFDLDGDSIRQKRPNALTRTLFSGQGFWTFTLFELMHR